MFLEALVLCVCRYIAVNRPKKNKNKEIIVFASQCRTCKAVPVGDCSCHRVASQPLAGFQLPPGKTPVGRISRYRLLLLSLPPPLLFLKLPAIPPCTQVTPPTLESVHAKCTTWRGASDNMDAVVGNHSH